MDNRVSFEVSWATLWRIFVFAALVVLFYMAKSVFGVLLLSIVISLGLDPVISFLERRKWSRLLGTIVVFVVGFLTLATIFYLLVPLIIIEAAEFIGYFNKTISALFGISLSQAVIRDFTLSLDKALNVLSAVNVFVPGAIGVIFEKVVYVFATIMISFYLMVEKDGTERLLRVILPDIYEKSAILVFTRFRQKIHNWFGAQLALSIIVGLLVSLGLWFLGVRYFLVIGLLAALFEVVPIVGPIVTGVVAFLVAVSDSLSLGFYAIIFFFVIQQLENHVLAPLVMGKALKVHPVIVIISLLAGAQIAGFIGIVLAVPIAVMAQEVFEYFSERKSRRSTLEV